MCQLQNLHCNTLCTVLDVRDRVFKNTVTIPIYVNYNYGFVMIESTIYRLHCNNISLQFHFIQLRLLKTQKLPTQTHQNEKQKIQ